MSFSPPGDTAALVRGPSTGSFRVLKFGGTSVGSAERIEGVVRILAERAGSERLIVVVSAMHGVTDTLAELAGLAEQGDDSFRDQIEAVTERHLKAARALVDPAELGSVSSQLSAVLAEVAKLAEGIFLVGECSPRSMDGILSTGERLSSVLVAACLRARGVAAEACDARAFVITDSSFGGARVDVAETTARAQERFRDTASVQVVTGFVAGTPDGETTVLGRGGSDYTAAILGEALEAEAVEIWTDVDGVMSSDPRLVPDAFSLSEISYDELVELSHFGAKVVYPPSVHPLRSAGISLVIRNTLRPEFPGTRVVARGSGREHPVQGISSINDVALLRLQGDGMVGVPGIAERLFGSLARSQVSVILISQASSEHSICFAVVPGDLESARAAIEAEFELERHVGWVDELVVEESRSVIAAVGEGMRETPGIAGQIFSVLGRAGINVHAIAQGSSELNISFVVNRADEERALCTIHRAFFSDSATVASIFLAGVGRVGSALLEQLFRRGDGEPVIRVGGLSNSRRAFFPEPGTDLIHWKAGLESSEESALALVQAAVEGYSGDAGNPNDASDASDASDADEANDANGAGDPGDAGPRVFVDCTASSSLGKHYPRLLGAGVSVVSANKLPFTGSLEQFQTLMDQSAQGAGLYYETTVGAGLPILGTLEDLVATGDRVEEIIGVLSGTLGFILDQVMMGRAFSEAVREAHASGLTEPDPREDLTGMDVARKALIAGRVAGWALEPDAVTVETLLPGQGWDEMDLQGFWDRLPKLDAGMADRVRSATDAGASLCYLARVVEAGASVAPIEVAPDHPCSGLAGRDNLILITSDRYRDPPLIVRGPGAGPRVTAAGVHADILRALREH